MSWVSYESLRTSSCLVSRWAIAGKLQTVTQAQVIMPSQGLDAVA
jgi:hypothetical protein